VVRCFAAFALLMTAPLLLTQTCAFVHSGALLKTELAAKLCLVSAEYYYASKDD